MPPDCNNNEQVCRTGFQFLRLGEAPSAECDEFRAESCSAFLEIVPSGGIRDYRTGMLTVRKPLLPLLGQVSPNGSLPEPREGVFGWQEVVLVRKIEDGNKVINMEPLERNRP